METTYDYLEKRSESKKSDHALAAANIKRELNRIFPGQKFSVKSETFAGGDSVSVSWEDGPTGEEVEAIINKYQSGDFDGMTDCYNYRGKSEFREAHGDAKYVHGNRHVSTEKYLEIAREMGYSEITADKHGALQGDWNTLQTIYREVNEKSFYTPPKKDTPLPKDTKDTGNGKKESRYSPELQEIHRENRNMSAADVLAALGSDIRQYAKQERDWIWIYFPEKPDDETREYIYGLGFDWAFKRKAWFHSCGTLLKKK